MVFTSDDNLWRPLLMIALYYQTKTPISFWCRRGLNHRSLIQPSETLLVELTGTQNSELYLYVCVCVYIYIYIYKFLPT